MTTGDDLRRGYQSGVSNSPDTAGVFVGTVTRIVSPDELYVRVPRLTGVFENRVRSSITDVQVNDQVFVALLEGRRDDFVVVGKVAPGSFLPTGEPTGFVNRTDSAISFATATRTFTISPVGGGFDVWVGGIKFPKKAAESVVIPNTSGIHYIYYNTSGVLTAKTTYFDLSVDAPVSYIYWNATDSTQYYFADERHGFTMDWATHEYLHRTRGAAFASGFTLTGYSTVGDGSANSHAQVSLDNGTFFDEDIEIAVTHSASPVSNTWEQRIQSNGYFPVFYRSGAAWKKDVATQYPLKFTTLATYNLNTAGSWSAQAVSSNKFGVYWLVATSNLNEPVMSVMGQNEYNTVGEAEATQWSSMDLTGLPIYEFRTLYRLVFQTATGYANSVKSRLVSVTDMRTTGSGVSGSPVPSGDHGSLTGLGDDDHVQYYNQTRGDARYLQLTGGALTGGISVIGTVTATTFSGSGASLTSIPNSATTATALNTASAIVARDGSGNFTAGTITATTFSGSGASLTNIPNSSTTATSLNTASAIVARDASGNFTAGTITAALTGNASTATTLQTARNINGVSFSGSADITVTAAAGTLTGTTLNSTVVTSSLTTLGASATAATQLRAGNGTNGLDLLGNRGDGFSLLRHSTKTASTDYIIASDGTGTFLRSESAGLITFVNGTTAVAQLNSSGTLTLSSGGTLASGSTANLTLTSGNGIVGMTNFQTTASTSGFQALYWGTTFANVARFTSRREVKEQIASLTETGAIVDALRPVSFVCKANGDETPEQAAWRLADVQHGFIAEEVAEVDSGRWAVWEPTADGSDLQPAAWRVHDLLALAIAEIKSIRARVAELEALS